MKNLLLGICFIGFALAVNAAEYKPTPKQKSFAEQVQAYDTVITTEWADSLILRVTVKLEAMGINPKLRAKLVADDIAVAGVNYMKKDICVKIYYGYLNKLAESCLFPEKESKE